MKYQIVYPDGTTLSACYLVGRDAEGKPLYRHFSTTPRQKLSPLEQAQARAFLGSILGAFS